MAKVSGKSMWAYLNVPDTRYEPAWKIDVVVNADTAKKLMDIGLRVVRTDDLKNPEEAALGPYKVKFSRNVEKRGRAKGQKNNPPEVMDADEAPFRDIIGNGSDVIVTFEPYRWEHKQTGKTGVSADLQKVKVITLVEYKPKDVEVEEETIPVADDDEMF